MTFADSTSFDFGDLNVFLTAFTSDQMATARIPYRVVALVNYAGDSWRGRYTCAISCTGQCGQAMWIFHDDNKSPQTWSTLPPWFPPLDPEYFDTRAIALERVLAELS